MSHLDAAIHVGKESVYGTPVTPTRSFEGQEDSFTRSMEPLESIGFRAGMQTVRSDRRKMINMGGTGNLVVDVLDKGMGLLLEGALGSATGPAQQGATAAYLSTFASTAGGPATSYTIQVVRSLADSDTNQAFTHHGCAVTGWTLTQEVGGLCVLSLTYDFEDVDTATAAATPAYPADTMPFDWTQCSVSVEGSPFIEVTSFNLSAELGMRTDRRYLRASSLKRQPRRAAVPTYSGTIVADFNSLTRYNEFANGDVVDNVIVKWTGRNIAAGHDAELTVTLPVVQWNGESPTASLTAATTQNLPFKALHDGTNPAVSLTYKSTDTTL